MSPENLKKLQDIYLSFRQADKLVPSELGENPSVEEVKNTDKLFTEYYHAVDEIRCQIGLLLDALLLE